MNEDEWIVAVAADEDTGAMQEYMRGKGSARQLRLFACACCRRIERLMTDRRSRRAVDVAERWADGAATEKQLEAAWSAADAAAAKIDDKLGEVEQDDSLEYYAALAAHWGAMRYESDGVAEVSRHEPWYTHRA